MSSSTLTPPSERDGDFSATAVATLESLNIFKGSSVRGKRTASAALLSPPSSEGSLSSGSSLSAVSMRSETTPTHFDFQLPTTLDSVETIEFCGFENRAAVEIMRRWSSRSSSSPDTLLDFVRSFITEMSRGGKTATQAMNDMLLSDRTQRAILDPFHRSVFGTQTYQHWILDTAMLHYNVVKRAHKRAQAIAADPPKPHKVGKSAKKVHVQDLWTPAGQSSATDPPTNVTISMKSDISGPVQCAVAVTTRPALRSEHKLLFKGKSPLDFEDDTLVDRDGTINLGAISTFSGGDFNCFSNASYWTAQEETAEAYRAYAAERCPYAETWLISIQVPVGFLNSLDKQELWFYGDHWEEYVWRCRGKKIPMPSKFDKYNNADLITGHILDAKSDVINKIQPHEVQQKMYDDMVMKLASSVHTRATQECFHNEKTIGQLSLEIRGKMHIDISPPKMPAEEF